MEARILDSKKELLLTAREFLLIPGRFCLCDHENLTKDDNGNLLPQARALCELRPITCAHLESVEYKGDHVVFSDIFKILSHVLKYIDSISKTHFYHKFLDLNSSIQELDVMYRFIRVNSLVPLYFPDLNFPTPTQPVGLLSLVDLDNQWNDIQRQLEELRKEMLATVEELLGL